MKTIITNIKKRGLIDFFYGFIMFSILSIMMPIYNFFWLRGLNDLRTDSVVHFFQSSMFVCMGITVILLILLVIFYKTRASRVEPMGKENDEKKKDDDTDDTIMLIRFGAVLFWTYFIGFLIFPGEGPVMSTIHNNARWQRRVGDQMIFARFSNNEADNWLSWVESISIPGTVLCNDTIVHKSKELTNGDTLTYIGGYPIMQFKTQDTFVFQIDCSYPLKEYSYSAGYDRYSQVLFDSNGENTDAKKLFSLGTLKTKYQKKYEEKLRSEKAEKEKKEADADQRKKEEHARKIAQRDSLYLLSLQR